MRGPLSFLVGCLTTPACYIGGRLVGAVLVRVSQNPVKWL